MYRIRFIKNVKGIGHKYLDFDNKNDLNSFLKRFNLDIDNRSNYNPNEIDMYDFFDDFSHTHFVTDYIFDKDRTTIVGFLGKKDCGNQDR